MNQTGDYEITYVVNNTKYKLKYYTRDENRLVDTVATHLFYEDICSYSDGDEVVEIFVDGEYYGTYILTLDRQPEFTFKHY